VAGEDVLGAGVNGDRKLAALLFLGGVYVAYDAMSTLNSSPWTHETFGSDASKAESAQKYVRLAIVRAVALGALASYVGGSPWPLIGVAVADADLYWVYRKAYHLAKGG
jgi:hypothetical protein